MFCIRGYIIPFICIKPIPSSGHADYANRRIADRMKFFVAFKLRLASDSEIAVEGEDRRDRFLNVVKDGLPTFLASLAREIRIAMDCFCIVVR